MTREIELLAQAAGKVRDQLADMAGNEQEKRQALLRHDLDRVESLLQSQQAMIMKLDNLETKRLEAQKAAGFGADATAEAILGAVGGEERALLEPIFRAIRQNAELYRDLNRVSLDIANTEMRLLGQTAAAAGESSGLYGNNGKKESGAHGVTFTEKV